MCSADTTNQKVFDQAVVNGMCCAHVPSRYLHVQPEPPKLEAGKWAYITGNVGCGKTHRACALLKAYLIDGMVSADGGRYWFPPKAKFITAAGYLAEVKKGFEGDGMAQTYKDTPFLVIDDLGQEVPTAWAVAELFELLNHRYNEELTTVITSQFTRGDIARRLAQNGGEEQALAIASRLAECCQVINLGERDRRLN